MSSQDKVTAAIELKVGSFIDLDGLESAINSTAHTAKTADGMTLMILNKHLMKLCKLQRTVLSEVKAGDSE